MADQRSEILHASPSLAGIAMWAAGKDVNFWVGVCGIVFILLQAAYLVWKWRRDVKRERERIAEHRPVGDE